MVKRDMVKSLDVLAKLYVGRTLKYYLIRGTSEYVCPIRIVRSDVVKMMKIPVKNSKSIPRIGLSSIYISSGAAYTYTVCEKYRNLDIVKRYFKNYMITVHDSPRDDSRYLGTIFNML